MATFSELINGDVPVLVDFSAEWCGPCKMMGPILEELKTQVGEKAVIIKVDVDKSPQAAQAYNIRSVPTLLIFRKGKIAWRNSGVMSAQQLQKVLETEV